MKLLKEVYKTREGALKRAAFENAHAYGEFRRGDKARLYRYIVRIDDTCPTQFRVARILAKDFH